MWNEFYLSLDSPELWKGVAFFLSMTLLIFPFYKAFENKIKKRSMEIALHLREAEKLYRESEKILKDRQNKDAEREKERMKIIKTALDSADNLKKDASKELDKRLLENKYQILDRVSLIRQTGLKKIKSELVSVAINSTVGALKKKPDQKQQDAFMKVGLDELHWLLQQDENIDLLRQELIEE